MLFDEEIDVQGLNCPIPVLHTKRAILRLNIGNILKVVATDPRIEKDLQTFCRVSGHDLVDSQENNGVFTLYLRRTKLK